MCYEELANATRRHRLQADGYAKGIRSIMPVGFASERTQIGRVIRPSDLEHMTYLSRCTEQRRDTQIANVI
jgi:hypothetical protein